MSWGHPDVVPRERQRVTSRSRCNEDVGPTLSQSSLSDTLEGMKYKIGMCVLGLALVGCGSSDDIGEFVKLDNTKGVAFEAGGDDCVAKAKSVGEWRKKNTKRYNELRKALGEKYKKGPPEKYKEELAKNGKSVMDAMMKCSNDPAFGKMMDETTTE